jgi:hypothetical protein
VLTASPLAEEAFVCHGTGELGGIVEDIQGLYTRKLNEAIAKIRVEVRKEVLAQIPTIRTEVKKEATRAVKPWVLAAVGVGVLALGAGTVALVKLRRRRRRR